MSAMEHIRSVFGEKVELLHDVHERLSCAQAVDFAKQCEKLRLFFLEDALAPEDIGWDANQKLGMATELQEVFPGCPELRNGYLYPNEKPGLGVEMDEKAAAKYPPIRQVDLWTQARLPDESLHRP